MVNILDFLFPKRCVGCKKLGSYVCSVCFSSIFFNVTSICPVCNKNSITGATHSFCRRRYTLDGLTCGVVYKGIVRKLVYQYKYKPFLSDLKKIISKLMHESLIQNELFYHVVSRQPVVIAVPIHRRRERNRGYNHADLLAKIVAGNFGLEYQKDMLVRIKDTKPQYKLSREKRLENVKGAFILNKKYQTIPNGIFLLIDDVATSCSTLNECARVLKRSGAKFVWAVTFARES